LINTSLEEAIMGKDVYERLARFLDELPGGFVHTEDGTELRILRRLFTSEEAEVAMHLALISEEAPVIARRAGLTISQATCLLEGMAAKGIIYRFLSPGKAPVFMAEQFVVGFWEGQVNHLDRELVEDFESIHPAYVDTGNWGKLPQLRTVPIRQSISSQAKIMPYEQIDVLVARFDRFAVANCICRQEMRIIGEDCGKPEETCLAFGSGADFFIQSGRGRMISRAEAVGLITAAEQHGLVLQVGNDQTLCVACGVCVERCPMKAISLDSGAAEINLDRCIGCGLCVSTCASGALQLVRKESALQRSVPKDTVEMNLKLAWARGKLGPFKLASMLLRSWFDRVMVRVAPPPG
jgi:electron transport complex protein RnfB